MGTNFYAIIPVKKRFTDKLRELADKLDNDTSYAYDADSDLYNLKEELSKQVVHLGKRSGGWVFDWDGNNMEFYVPNLKSIKNFIDTSKAQIVDEYGHPYTWDEFINDELGDILYVKSGAMTGKEYYEKFPEHRTPYCREYGKAISMYKRFAKDEFIDPKYHDFITKDGLRFALFTDFS